MAAYAETDNAPSPDEGLPPDEGSAEQPQDNSGGEDTLFIPPDHIPDADSLKPGDKRELTFVGKNNDGALEWSYSGGGESTNESMEDEMRRTVDGPMPKMGMKEM